MPYLLGQGLYLLRTREFINNNQNIYKFGRSYNLTKRITQYPNKSIVYLLIECDDSIKHESKIIEFFRNKYKSERDVGNEYFSGNLTEIIDDIINYVNLVMIGKKYGMIKEDIIIDKKTKLDDKSIFQNQLENAKCIVINQNINNFIMNQDGDGIEDKCNKIAELIENFNKKVIDEPIDEGLKCICGKIFSSKHALKRHINNRNIKCHSKNNSILQDKTQNKETTNNQVSNITETDNNNSIDEQNIIIPQENISYDSIYKGYSCPCGFKALYESKLVKHINANNKCKYLKELSKKTVQESNNKTKNKTNIDDIISKLEKELALVKCFKVIYDRCNDVEKNKLFESKEHKDCVSIIMRHNKSIA